MKNLLLVVVLAATAFAAYQRIQTQATPADQTERVVQSRLGANESNTQVQGVGVVDRVLADDNEGSHHQRFILRLASGQTLLVAHNIDLAPRVAGLESGDTVEFNGEYEWNEKGGVIHWTHRDPANQHVAGWLKHDGQVFQ
jgi:hypothetical protein